MPILDADDPRKVPSRPTVTSFCDGCHTLTRVTQVKGVRGTHWFCTDCLPAVHYVTASPHSPPPSDPVPNPALDQWLEPVPPPDLDEGIPRDLLDEAIDHAYAAPEPITPERGHEPHDAGGG